MKSASVVKVSLVGIAAAALIALGAAPASASPTPRPLPAGQHLYAIGCDLTDAATPTSVDPTTAAATLIGAAQPGRNCAGQSAWDPANQTAYFVEYNNNALYTVDLATGAESDVALFNAAVAPPGINSMMIGVNNDAYLFGQDHNLYSVNLTTAKITLIGPTGVATDLDAAAFDPANGTFYALDTGGKLYTVNVVTGGLTLAGVLNSGNVENGSYSLQFDATGTLWVEEDGASAGIADLWTYLPTALTTSGIEVNDIEVGGGAFYTESLLIPTEAFVTVSPKSMAPGATVTVTGTGFAPGEPVTVHLDASSTLLASVTASAAGIVSATITIPVGTADGAHTVVLFGPVSGLVGTAIRVTSVVVPTKTDGGPVLATTGVDAQTPLELGGILLALGIALFVTRRLTMRRKLTSS